MKNLKHVGRIVSTKRKCIVVFRTLPGDSSNCLIVTTENLPDNQHDALINLVESSAGQDANEFADVMSRTQFPDGSVMLANLHVNGRLVKVPTDSVEMIPNSSTTILLSELNQIIAQNRNCAVDDLAIKSDIANQPEVKTIAQVKEEPTVQEPQESVSKSDIKVDIDSMSDQEKATYYRSQSSKLYAEAAKLRKLADTLVPPERKEKPVEPTEPVVKKPRATKAKAA